MFDLADISWVAVAISTVTGFLIGGVWYGPLFGRAWVAAMGKDPTAMDDPERKQELMDEFGSPAQAMSISFVSQLVTAIVMSLVLGATGTPDLTNGLLLGGALGVGLVATGMASDYAFCGWGMKLFLIQAGYRITYCLAMGAILGGMA